VDLRTSTWGVAAVLVLSIASEAAAGICLDVNLRFAGRHVSGRLVESMRTEVSSIWSLYGVRIQWSTPPGGVGCAPFKPVLGGTWMSTGGIDRAPIRIDRDATEQLIRSLAVDELYRRLVGPILIQQTWVARSAGFSLTRSENANTLSERAVDLRRRSRPETGH
jgi:hypothetical protein